MGLAAATLSNGGEMPAPRLMVAVNTPQSGWVMVPPTADTRQVFSPEAANNTAYALSDVNHSFWRVVSAGVEGSQAPTEAMPGSSWFLGGTLPDWGGVPLAVAVLLEEYNPQRALEMGESMLQAAMHP
jgi:membrane peptidoglycan carboxypeptidase